MVLKLKSPHRDGTTHIVMQPKELTQSLAALVPLPQLHLIRNHGVLAPNATLRGAVIAKPARKDSALAQEHTQGPAARLRWARLLKRVFDIDMKSCACCGQLKILVSIKEPVVIVRILTHVGLPPRAAAREAARLFSLDYAA